jgi:hypothetical protein
MESWPSCRPINSETQNDGLGKDEFDSGCLDCEVEGEDGLGEPEPEIDVETDPLSMNRSDKPDRNWEGMIRSLKVRKPKTPSDQEQRERICWILEILNSEGENPSKEQLEEALNWIQNIKDWIPNHEEFVASNFSHYYPAWEELLKGVKRKSARAVLSWVRTGFKPRFVGTQNAKPAKKKIVMAMLRKVAAKDQIHKLLTGRLPHRVHFANHQSLYDKWEFTSDQVVKLIEAGAAGI